MSFQDHFSGHAADYAAHRPRYPDGLFNYLAFLSPRRVLAWDCATGNGQAAVMLARTFQKVIATDASQQQIDEHIPHERVDYRVAPAEASALEAASVDLVTVAQAMHWFRLDEFYAEVRRVTRPGGMLAAWAYDLHRVGPGVNEVLDRYYNDIIGSYWPPERDLVEQGYRTIKFPFREPLTPTFEMRHDWTMTQLMDYMGTWSATKYYQKANGDDPREIIRADLTAAWGRPEETRTVHWPIHLRIGYVE